MLGSVTSVCLEGAYAHYHPEVVDILFWAVLLEWYNTPQADATYIALRK